MFPGGELERDARVGNSLAAAKSCRFERFGEIAIIETMESEYY